jgi:hypothetical protein
MKFKLASYLSVLGITLLPPPAVAFKLKPEGSFIERKLANRSQSYWEKLLSGSALKGIDKIGESVHEEITNRVLGCEGDEDICAAPDYEPKNAYVLAGVRWNDDPPFRFEKDQGNFGGCEPGSTVRLVTFPRCWANVFKNGKKRAGRGEVLNADNAPLLVRSHFGDLQFLHAMANRDSESASDVRNRIIAWAEFTWRIALGEFSLSTRVKDVPVSGIVEFFGTKGWSIQDLFALGNPHVRKPENMSELAFGSLLHVVEDSFANGHVERAMPDGQEKCPEAANGYTMPGKIKEFHSYVNQDSSRHGDDDARNAFSANWSGPRPNVVDVGRTLNEFFVRRAPWNEVKPYIECIFTLDTDARPASAGARYIKARAF